MVWPPFIKFFFWVFLVNFLRHRKEMLVQHEKQIYFLHEAIYLTCLEKHDALRMVRKDSLKFVIVHMTESEGSSTVTFHPPSLCEIFKFDRLMTSLAHRYQYCKILLCVGSKASHRLKATFLAACHKMISHRVSLQSSLEIFNRNIGALAGEEWNEFAGKSADGCIRAVNHAIKNRWIDVDQEFESRQTREESIHVDEYLHYAR